MAKGDRGGLRRQHPFHHLDAGGGKSLEPLPRRARVRIAQRDYGARRLRCGNDIGASKPSSPFMGTRLKGHIEGGAPGSGAGAVKRNGLGMGAAARRRPAAGDDLP